MYFKLQGKKSFFINLEFEFFSKFINLLSSEDFAQAAKAASCVFSRKRVLTIQSLVLIILSFSNRSAHYSASTFLSKCTKKIGAICYDVCSASALTQARRKLSYTCFDLLNDFILKYRYNGTLRIKKLYDYKIIAIDTSWIRLPNSEELLNYFGTFKNQAIKNVPGAKMSMVYDVLNKQILHATLGKTFMNDVESCLGHLDAIEVGKSILLFDRGYASLRLIIRLMKGNTRFVIRFTKTWAKLIQLAGDSKDECIVLKKGYRYKIKNKKLRLEEDITLRVVKIMLSSGQEEVLITNLIDSEQFSTKDMYKLYGMRWGIEEGFKTLKEGLNIEKLHSKSVNGVLQEFYAKVLMYNLNSLLIQTSLQPEIDKKIERQKNKPKHKKQINYTAVINRIRDELVMIFNSPDLENTLLCLKYELIMKVDIVRKDRHFIRGRKNTWSKRSVNQAVTP